MAPLCAFFSSGFLGYLGCLAISRMNRGHSDLLKGTRPLVGYNPCRRPTRSHFQERWCGHEGPARRRLVPSVVFCVLLFFEKGKPSLGAFTTQEFHPVLPRGGGS